MYRVIDTLNDEVYPAITESDVAQAVDYILGDIQYDTALITELLDSFPYVDPAYSTTLDIRIEQV